jgi:hypothetical protein
MRVHACALGEAHSSLRLYDGTKRFFLHASSSIMVAQIDAEMMHCTNKACMRELIAHADEKTSETSLLWKENQELELRNWNCAIRAEASKSFSNYLCGCAKDLLTTGLAVKEL